MWHRLRQAPLIIVAPLPPRLPPPQKKKNIYFYMVWGRGMIITSLHFHAFASRIKIINFIVKLQEHNTQYVKQMSRYKVLIPQFTGRVLVVPQLILMSYFHWGQRLKGLTPREVLSGSQPASNWIRSSTVDVCFQEPRTWAYIHTSIQSLLYTVGNSILVVPASRPCRHQSWSMEIICGYIYLLCLFNLFLFHLININTHVKR